MLKKAAGIIGALVLLVLLQIVVTGLGEADESGTALSLAGLVFCTVWISYKFFANMEVDLSIKVLWGISLILLISNFVSIPNWSFYLFSILWVIGLLAWGQSIKTKETE